MRERLCLPVGLLLTVILVGCGGGPSAEDLGMESPEVEYAKLVTEEVNNLLTAAKKEGPRGVESGIDGFLENLEGFEDEAVGEHEETYKKIYEAGQELQKMLQARAPPKEIYQKIQAMQSLTAQLPKAGASSD